MKWNDCKYFFTLFHFALLPVGLVVNLVWREEGLGVGRGDKCFLQSPLFRWLRGSSLPVITNSEKNTIAIEVLRCYFSRARRWWKGMYWLVLRQCTIASYLVSRPTRDFSEISCQGLDKSRSSKKGQVAAVELDQKDVYSELTTTKCLVGTS